VEWRHHSDVAKSSMHEASKPVPVPTGSERTVGARGGCVPKAAGLSKLNHKFDQNYFVAAVNTNSTSTAVVSDIPCSPKR
jgi:hypothetical protein